MWEQLKKILKTSNEKAVIIEEGEPKYVILSVDEYLRLQNLDGVPSNNSKELNLPNNFENTQDTPAAKNISNLNEGSIFMGEINPQLEEAPIDLADINPSNNADSADSEKGSRGISLNDLPL